MNLSYNGQLMTTSLTVTFRGKINTKNRQCSCGYRVFSYCYFTRYFGNNRSSGDTIYEAYGIGGSVPFYTKNIDEIQIGLFTIKDFEIDVGMLPKEHSALLGLDILKEHNCIIDLYNLELYSSMRKPED